jgi:hypothetical protein
VTAEPRWLLQPLSRKRLDVRVRTGEGMRAALSLYPPKSPMRHLILNVRRMLLSARLARRSSAPVADLDGLFDYLGVRAGAVMARRAAPGRRTIAVSAGDELALVLKIGPLTDRALRREAAMLFALGIDGRAEFVPKLRWAGIWDDRFLIATTAVPRARRPNELVPDGLLDLCVALATGGPWGGPVIHGDLAPWNLIIRPEGEPVLVDWEHSRFGEQPLFDMTHFIATQATRLGRSSREAVATLVNEGSVGQQYLAAIGEDPHTARDVVRESLMKGRASKMRDAMLAELDRP